MVTHKQAVKSAILLDKYCEQRHHMCVGGKKCVFGASECPFEYGTPYYDKQDREEMLDRAELMDAMESTEDKSCVN